MGALEDARGLLGLEEQALLARGRPDLAAERRREIVEIDQRLVELLGRHPAPLR
jgi:hypothetical protein